MADAAHHGDATRARIIQTALALIADRGFAATSTREISERLGFTKAALYYHFRTKEDLLAAIIEPAMEDLRRLVGTGAPDSGDPADATPALRRRLMAGYVDLVTAHADLIRVLSNDPAVRACAPLASSMTLYEQLVQLLSASRDPDLAQRTRVRCALGAVHAGILHGAPSPADGDVAREVTLSVACAAIGVSAGAPRRHMSAARA